MVAAGLGAIFFVCTLVCWTIWSLLYSLVASHYFLTTLTDSSSGQDQVYYPREGFLEWWWKPLMCAWVLLFWLVPATLVLSPLLAINTSTFLIVWALVLWIGFPLSLTSVLYAQHWLHFVHRGVIGRMLQHRFSFVYVHLVTLAFSAGCLYLLVRGLTDILWLIPAIVLVPAAQLLYARHWGRFAWLSLNYLPRAPQKGADSEQTPRPDEESELNDGPLPELGDPLSAEDADAAAEEAFREEPPASEAIQPAPAPAPPPPEDEDPWTDTKPYGVVGDGQGSFEEKAAAPRPVAAAAPSPAPPPMAEEDEDEWSTDKKPYAFTEPEAEPVPSSAEVTKSDADTALTMSKYYDERAKKEAEEKRRRAAEAKKMPPRRKKPPSFYAALIGGVWSFLLYPSTLMAWATLAVFTLVEFLLMYVMVMFYPK